MTDTTMRALIVRAAAVPTVRAVLAGSSVAQLADGLRLIPLTDAVVEPFEDGVIDEVTGLPPGLLEAVHAAVPRHPVMFYRLDHDRQQDQVAMLWRGGAVIKGPTRINTALEAMGVDPDGGRDAMTYVGLRRFRTMASFTAGQTVAEASRVRPMQRAAPAAERSRRGSSGRGVRAVVGVVMVLAALGGFVAYAGGVDAALAMLRSLLSPR